MPRPELLNILVIDDDRAMRHMLRLVLEREHYRISEAENVEKALEMISKEVFDAILCDIRMPGTDGLGFLALPQVRASDTIIIMMSAYGNLDTAIECMKRGAYDYISKPFKPDEVLLTLKKAEERLRLERENFRLKQKIQQQDQGPVTGQIIHSSAIMEELLEQVDRLANSDTPVLITGETGTGKELVAQALHHQSPRSAQPFLALNCSAISSGLLESELFGHLRGSFTGADRNHQGLFAAASDGTLFLDEIAELPLDLQPKLLRVLQEKEIRPVGATQPQKINTRVIAATSGDLKDLVRQQLFREDLYYRLAVVDLNVPPLRKRTEDIAILGQYFLREITARQGLPPAALSAADIKRLQKYPWPGNVRELQNFIEKTVIFSRPGEIRLCQLPEERRERLRCDENLSLKNTINRIEREYIERALAKTGGNRTQAAKLLEISLRSLMYKIKEYELE